MLRPSPNHGTQRLPNDDDDDIYMYVGVCTVQDNNSENGRSQVCKLPDQYGEA